MTNRFVEMNLSAETIPVSDPEPALLEAEQDPTVAFVKNVNLVTVTVNSISFKSYSRDEKFRKTLNYPFFHDICPTCFIKIMFYTIEKN